MTEELYKGKLRWYREIPNVTEDDVNRVAKEICISLSLAKVYIYSKLNQPKLQQYDGEEWNDVLCFDIKVDVDIDQLIKENQNSMTSMSYNLKNS